VRDLPGPVVAAELRLRVANGSTDGGEVFPVEGAWDESSITWQDAPGPEDSPLASIGRVVPGTVDVPLAAGAITGDGTYSFAVAAARDTLTIYSSREGAAAPELVVTTAPPAPSPPTQVEPPAAAAQQPPDPAPAPQAAHPRRAALTAAAARQQAAQALRRRAGSGWASARARRLSCRRITGAAFTCRASWRGRRRHRAARIAVTRRGAAVAVRVRLVG
jgi:hypothetical protein